MRNFISTALALAIFANGLNAIKIERESQFGDFLKNIADVASKGATAAGVEVPTDLNDLAGAAAGAAGVEIPTDMANL